MKVLVTGCAGYLGSIVGQVLLDAGYQVRGYDNLMYGGESALHLLCRDGFELLAGDVRDRTQTRRALDGVDAVVHLAAIVGDPACAQDPNTARAVNQEASLNLIKDARDCGVNRLVFASTCSNYGRMRDTSTLATEDHELLPVSLYAETKVAVERVLLETSSPAWTVLRFATLYGLSPRMRFDLTVNQFVLEAMTQKRLVVFGEQFWRPYVHVRDAARAIACVLQSPVDRVQGAIFNVGDTAENYRKLDLVRIVQEQVGGFDVQYVHKTEDPRDYRVSFDRIQSRLGYKVSRRVREGVAEIAHVVRCGLFADQTTGRYQNAAT
jgi:nucleoside-diphosphate-sugar epimerase